MHRFLTGPWTWVFWSLAAAVLSCFDPQYENVECTAFTSDCPPGFVCYPESPFCVSLEDAICLADESYGEADLAGPTATVWACDGADPSQCSYSITGRLGGPDILEISLDRHGGVFAAQGGIATGTYEIADELNSEYCGLCVRLWIDGFVDDEGNIFGASRLYYATGGTVELIAISPNIIGRLENVTFEHVNLLQDEGFEDYPPHPDGCRSEVTKASFEVPAPPPMSRAPAPSP